MLERCSLAAFTIGKVCCVIQAIPGGAEDGDVMGILHGDRSSLLHEVRTDPPPPPPKEVLQRNPNGIFTTNLTEGNFPLISTSPSKLLLKVSYVHCQETGKYIMCPKF